MKRYFYFVRRPHRFTPDDVIFRVAVGTSDKECVQLSLLREYCKDCGYYLQLVNDQSDKAIDFLLQSIMPDVKFPRLRIRKATLHVGQLYDLIISGQLEAYESSLAMPKGTFYLLSSIDPAFFFKNSKEGKKGLPFPQIRKDLSKTDDSPSSYVGVAAVAILILFLLAGHLEYLENQLYF